MKKRIAVISLLIFSGLLLFGSAAYCLLEYDMSGGFDDTIKNNPIDRDYQKEIDALNNSKGFNTQACVEIESK